jgi:hypothetical protein
MSSFENFSHLIQVRLIPHAGPTRHIFGEWIGWKTHWNRNLESVSAKNKNILLLDHGLTRPPYPRLRALSHYFFALSPISLQSSSSPFFLFEPLSPHAVSF